MSPVLFAAETAGTGAHLPLSRPASRQSAGSLAALAALVPSILLSSLAPKQTGAGPGMIGICASEMNQE